MIKISLYLGMITEDMLLRPGCLSLRMQVLQLLWALVFIFHCLMIKRVFLTADQNCYCSEFFLLLSCPLIVYLQEETGFFSMSVSVV